MSVILSLIFHLLQVFQYLARNNYTQRSINKSPAHGFHNNIKVAQYAIGLATGYLFCTKR